MGQQGWQQSGAFNVMFAALVPSEIYLAVYGDKNAEVAAGAEVDKNEVRLPEGVIRHTGDFEIAVQVHSDVTATVKLAVVAE